MGIRRSFALFLQITGLMTTASALFIGIKEGEPATQLAIMAGGMLVFWFGVVVGGGGAGASGPQLPS